jgi:hypothetical protein
VEQVPSLAPGTPAQTVTEGSITLAAFGTKTLRIRRR